MKSTNSFPKISIITPSYNQAEFLERTILSVIEQNYPNLEFIIIDGGSTDGSVEIIKKYETDIDYWVSEPDSGQAHAINKGLKLATGDWVAWQNSDDIFYPGAFVALADAARKEPDAGLVIGDMNLIDENDNVIRDLHFVTPSFMAMVAEGMVFSNQAAFWKRKVHDEIKYLDETLDLGFELDWFLRLTRHVKGYATNQCLGGFRIHSSAKTQVFVEPNQAAMRLVRERHDANLSALKKNYYKFVRVLQLLKRGDFAYVYRGACSYIRLIPSRAKSYLTRLLIKG